MSFSNRKGREPKGSLLFCPFFGKFSFHLGLLSRPKARKAPSLESTDLSKLLTFANYWGKPMAYFHRILPITILE